MSEDHMIYFGGNETRVSRHWTRVPNPFEISYRRGGRTRTAVHSYRSFDNAFCFPPSLAIVDLYTIVSAVYIADRWIARHPRKPKVGPSTATDGWSRTLTLSIPVQQPDIWNLEAVSSILIRLLDFLTSDSWNIEFRKGDPHKDWQAELHGFTANPAEQVALFSGGLDSYCYTVGNLNAANVPTILVSHLNPPSLQDRLSELLLPLGPHLQPAQFRVQVNRFHPRQENEPTQRTRGLLFMAAGLLLCSSNRVSWLWVPENGFLSVNPPLTPSRPGACMTKSVHPLALHLLNALLEQLNVPQRVENPYALRTKGEVCREVVQNGSTTLDQLARTITCSRPESRQGAVFANCGYCYACLVRHASLGAGGDDQTDYRNVELPVPNGIPENRREDWLALRDWLSRDYTVKDLIAGSSLPPGADLAELTDVVRRSRTELQAAFG